MSILDQFRRVVLFLSEYFADLLIYIRYCGVSPLQNSNRKLFYKILMEAHALEKGLSLDKPRLLFGKEKIDILMKDLNDYDLSHSKFPAEMACGAFRCYLEMHATHGIKDRCLTKLTNFLDNYEKENEITPNGGLREKIHSQKSESLTESAQLLVTRHSIRMFSTGQISLDSIAKMVSIAQSAPSQCNRQSSKVYFFQDRMTINKLLELQAGSSGFTDKVENLFVVTSDIAAWRGAQQRNQVYIDGALFSMSLMLACHANDFATCPLNLAITHKTERAIKRVASISTEERLIMMIAVGLPVLSDELRVARSPRRPLEEIFVTEITNS